jgi:hypothetical protein
MTYALCLRVGDLALKRTRKAPEFIESHLGRTHLAGGANHSWSIGGGSLPGTLMNRT